MIPTREVRPWWLAEELPCSFCLHVYALMLETHCSGCDQAVCPGCVVVVEGVLGAWCPHCSPHAEERE
jgi:hypothetical protein